MKLIYKYFSDCSSPVAGLLVIPAPVLIAVYPDGDNVVIMEKCFQNLIVIDIASG